MPSQQPARRLAILTTWVIKTYKRTNSSKIYLALKRLNNSILNLMSKGQKFLLMRNQLFRRQHCRLTRVLPAPPAALDAPRTGRSFFRLRAAKINCFPRRRQIIFKLFRGRQILFQRSNLRFCLELAGRIVFLYFRRFLNALICRNRRRSCLIRQIFICLRRTCGNLMPYIRSRAFRFLQVKSETDDCEKKPDTDYEQRNFIVNFVLRFANVAKTPACQKTRINPFDFIAAIAAKFWFIKHNFLTSTNRRFDNPGLNPRCVAPVVFRT